MSLDERTEQQLIALVGRVEDLENAASVNLNPYAKLAYVNNLFPLAKTANVETMSSTTNKQLRQNEPTLQVLNMDGGERTLLLPVVSKENPFFIIINNSS